MKSDGIGTISAIVAAAIRSIDAARPTVCAVVDGTHGTEVLAHVQPARRLHICAYIEKQKNFILFQNEIIAI